MFKHDGNTNLMEVMVVGFQIKETSRTWKSDIRFI